MPHLHTPPFSPSLISHTVSVDVNSSNYLLTRSVSGHWPFQVGMAHSTLEQPRSLSLSTGNGPFHCGTAQSVSDRNDPFHCATDPHFSGHCPFRCGTVQCYFRASPLSTGSGPFHYGTAPFCFRAFPLSNRNGRFHCFRILPVSALFQDIAPFTSVSGYCPFHFCFRILPL